MAGKEYQMAFSIGAKLQGQFNSAFKGAQSSVVALQNQITSLNKTQGDITAYQKQQQAIEKTKSKLQTLQQQYATLKASMGENGEASEELKNKMLAKEKQIERTTERLGNQEAQLNATGNALREAGVDTQALGMASSQLETRIASLKSEQEQLATATNGTGESMRGAADSMSEFVSALGIQEVLKEAFDVMKQCTDEAIAFENSMAAVKRTVGGSDEFLSGMADDFKQLSTEIPITTAELTEIATTAGQLGIAQGNVESFTTVMAKLATTTDLTASDAATMLAQFANVTGLTDYERLGSVIAELGDATATTASKVVQMSQGMAASASLAGMSSTDILAIAAAVGSLGIEAQAGSTAMSTIINTIYKATETGENLEQFASVAGMSAIQFKQAWGENAVKALDAFIQGLNNTERNGKSAIVVLDELGINNVRQTKAILGLASAGDLLTQTIAQANGAWESNTALTAKASIMYETTQAKLTMMNNAFSNLNIAVGDAFLPVISAGAEALTGMMAPVTEFIEKNPLLVKAFAAVAGAVAAVTAALAAGTIAAKMFGTMVAMIPGVKTILLITAAVAALAVAVTALIDAFGGGAQSMTELDNEFDSLNQQIQEQQEIIDLCDRYRRLRRELHDTSEEVNGLSFDDVDVHLTATADASVTPEDFMIDGDESIILTAEQVAELYASGFLDKDDPGIEISAGQIADLVESGFLKPDDPGITLTAQQTADLLAAGFMSSSDEGVTLTAGQVSNLQAKGFLKPDDPGIEISAKQFADLYERGFFNPSDPGIILTAEQRAELVASGFLKEDDAGITLTAEQTASLYSSGFLKEDDQGIVLTAQQTDSLLAMGFLSPEDPGITLTAEQTADLIAAGFMSPEDAGINVEAQQVADLLAEGFLKSDDEGITLTAEQTADLVAAGFLQADDKGITLTAEQTATLLASGFLNPNDQGITLTAEQVKTLEAAGFMTSLSVALTGTATQDLTASDFVKDPNLALHANIDNLPELQAAASDLATKANDAKEAFTQANSDLQAMQQRYQELTARKKYASTDSDKSALQEELDTLSGTIDAQKTKVDKLRGAYEEASGQYTVVATVAGALSEKQAELAATGEKIVAASGGVVTALSSESEELERQLQITESLAKAKQADLRAQVRDNITRQASAYAESLADAAYN